MFFFLLPEETGRPASNAPHTLAPLEPVGRPATGTGWGAKSLRGAKLSRNHDHVRSHNHRRGAWHSPERHPTACGGEFSLLHSHAAARTVEDSRSWHSNYRRKQTHLSPRALVNPRLVQSVSCGSRGGGVPIPVGGSGGGGGGGGGGARLPQSPETTRSLHRDAETITTGAGVVSPSVGHQMPPSNVAASFTAAKTGGGGDGGGKGWGGGGRGGGGVGISQEGKTIRPTTAPEHVPRHHHGSGLGMRQGQGQAQGQGRPQSGQDGNPSEPTRVASPPTRSYVWLCGEERSPDRGQGGIHSLSSPAASPSVVAIETPIALPIPCPGRLAVSHEGDIARVVVVGGGGDAETRPPSPTHTVALAVVGSSKQSPRSVVGRAGCGFGDTTTATGVSSGGAAAAAMHTEAPKAAVTRYHAAPAAAATARGRPQVAMARGEELVSTVQFGFRSRPTTSRVLPLGPGWAVGRRRGLARQSQGDRLGFDLEDLVGPTLTARPSTGANTSADMWSRVHVGFLGKAGVGEQMDRQGVPDRPQERGRGWGRRRVGAAGMKVEGSRVFGGEYSW